MYMYEQDLALNNLEGLIYLKTQQTTHEYHVQKKFPKNTGTKSRYKLNAILQSFKHKITLG